MIKLTKRGPMIMMVGLILATSSLIIMSSILPADMPKNEELHIPTLFKGLFNQVSDEIQILPGTPSYYSYNVKSSDVSVLWGVKIIDKKHDDKISVNISNIFGDQYGVFSQTSPIIFETLEISSPDTLNFELQNQGSRIVNVVLMFSEEPKNFDSFSNPDSPLITMILPVAISGIFFILGILVFCIGIIVSLVDRKNIQNNKRNN